MPEAPGPLLGVLKRDQQGSRTRPVLPVCCFRLIGLCKSIILSLRQRITFSGCAVKLLQLLVERGIAQLRLSYRVQVPRETPPHLFLRILKQQKLEATSQKSARIKTQRNEYPCFSVLFFPKNFCMALASQIVIETPIPPSVRSWTSDVHGRGHRLSQRSKAMSRP